MRAFVLFLAALGLAVPGLAQAVDLGLYAGSHLGVGHEGDGVDGSPYTGRTMANLDFQAMPGVRTSGKMILIGLLFDLRLTPQLTSASSAGGTDFTGTGLSIGPGAEFDLLSTVKFLFSWDWRDRQTIKNPEATLKGSGFHFLLGYKAMPTLWLDLEYVISGYNTLYTDGTGDMGLPNGSVTQHNVGLGASVSF